LYDKAAASSGHVTTGSNGAAAGSSPRVISEAQRKRLYAMSKEANLSDDDLKALVTEVAGVQSSKEIPVGKYDQLCEAVQGAGIPF
jgi:hypothetical protein